METSTNKKYPLSDLTENIIGCIFDVYNHIGYGLPEKVYQSSLAECFKEKKINFSREKYSFIKFGGKIVGKFFLDFIVENKVAVELKVRYEQRESDVNQLLNYLKTEKLKIGLLFVITPQGVKIKRLIN